MPMIGKRPNVFAAPVAKAYRPTMRDQAATVLTNVLGNTYQGNRIARNVFGSSGLGGGQGNLLGGLGILDLTPIGAAFALEEAGRQIGGGQPVTGAANVALGMVPIPAVAKGGKAVAKGVARRVAGIGHNRPPTTKKASAPDSRYARQADAGPVVTQAGARREPLGGPEQHRAQHPGAFGPYHNLKPQIDPNEVAGIYEPLNPWGLPPVRRITPADLEGGDVISLYGDRTRAGERLMGLQGAPFERPVDLHGGPDFGRMHESAGSRSVWASEPSPTAGLKKKIAKSLSEGRNVFGVYTPMGPQSLDQTTMMTDTLAQMIKQSELSPSSVAAFDKSVAQLGLPSISDPDAVAAALATKNQGQRLAWVRAIDNASRLAEGFPEVGAARLALTNPELREMPAGASGYRVMKFGPESLEAVTETPIRHGSYSANILGENLGAFDELVPFNMLFRDTFNQRRAEGRDYLSDLRALELSKPVQTMTPEVVDSLMSYQLGARRRR